MITLQTTVNQLIDRDSRWMNVLNEWNVDTCRGGNHSLELAAKEAGIQPNEFMQRIKQTQEKWA